jgi:dTDP-4-amino-4,6-dideoxygalactose transaminase
MGLEMKYPLFKVHMPVQEALAGIRAVLESGFVNEGEQVSEFHRSLSSFLDVENLVLTNSCTSSLTLAMKIAGVGPDTEVISTAMTCVATNTPVVNLGAKVVWADVLADSGSIDPADIEKKITDKTRAIVFVNWAGTPCDLEAISEIGKKYKVPVIQDAAHSFGALWNGQPISDFADFTCLSFQAIKHLSSGDGGALICKDADDYLLARKLKWFGYDRDSLKDEKGEWKGQRWSADIRPGEVGFKFNMNNISAAIGLAQMDHIQNLLDAHRRNAALYDQGFADFPHICSLSVPRNATSSYWVYTCLFQGSEALRDELIEALNQHGIAAGLVHLPNDIYSAFEEFSAELPGTLAFSSSQISLPCGWWLSENDCLYIVDKVREIAAEIIAKGA